MINEWENCLTNLLVDKRRLNLLLQMSCSQKWKYTFETHSIGFVWRAPRFNIHFKQLSRSCDQNNFVVFQKWVMSNVLDGQYFSLYSSYSNFAGLEHLDVWSVSFYLVGGGCSRSCCTGFSEVSGPATVYHAVHWPREKMFQDLSADRRWPTDLLWCIN